MYWKFLKRSQKAKTINGSSLDYSLETRRDLKLQETNVTSVYINEYF